MRKSDLITLLADRFPTLSRTDVDVSVRAILESISAALCRNDRVEIRGFGTFGLNFRKPRTGRNPKTGALVAVPAMYAPHFRAGKEMRERVDQAAGTSTHNDS